MCEGGKAAHLCSVKVSPDAFYLLLPLLHPGNAVLGLFKHAHRFKRSCKLPISDESVTTCSFYWVSMHPPLPLSPASVFRGVSPWRSKYQRMETGEQGSVCIANPARTQWECSTNWDSFSLLGPVNYISAWKLDQNNATVSYDVAAIKEAVI